MNNMIKNLLIINIFCLVNTATLAYTPCTPNLWEELNKKFDDYYSDEHCSEDFIIVKKDNKKGVVNTKNDVIKPLTDIKYEDIQELTNNFAIVTMETSQSSSGLLYGFIDKMGKEITKIEYDKVHNFSEGLAKVSKNKKWGFIDATGKEIIPLQYDNALSFHNGLASIQQNGQYGFINKTGEIIIPMQFEDSLSFTSDWVAVKKNGKWGFIDKTGKTMLDFAYDNARNFYQELAPVQTKSFLQKHSQWGFINRKGKTIIPFKYDDAEFYQGIDSHPRAKKNDKWIFFNNKGEIIDEPNFCCYGPIKGTHNDKD